MKINKTQIFKMVMASVMIALNVVLERFLAIQTGKSHLSLSIITIVFPLIFLGTYYAVVVAALGDIIGTVCVQGAYFPGFTLTNILVALCLALFLRKKITVFRVIVATFINKLFFSTLLNSLWVAITVTKLNITSFAAYYVYIADRIVGIILMFVVEIVIILALFHEKSSIRKRLDKEVKKVL